MTEHIPQKIKLLIDTLNAKAKWKTDELLSLLEELAISESDIACYQCYNHEKSLSYGRNKIYSNQKFRIYLMSWDYGDATAIHDHGSTDFGAVQFFGNMEHRCYKYDNQQLKKVQEETILQGQIVPVQGSLIHMMANSQQQSVCTLHIYGMNTGDCQEDRAIVFQPEKERIVQTSGTAYLNMDETAILSSQKMLPLSPVDYDDYQGLVLPFFERFSVS